MALSSSRVTRRWVQRLREITREMWFRVGLFSATGVALAVLASVLGSRLSYIPQIELAAGSVNALLNIIASSMLAVTTFSMSIITGAYGSAASGATPKATQLLESDPVAQNAVSFFIGSFLFSIVGIIGLSAGFYPGQSRVLLFAATLIDILLIVWTLLRWVDHLNSFGRLGDLIGRIEAAATEAATLYRDHPRLGALPLPNDTGGWLALPSDRAGHLRHIDMAALQERAEAGGWRLAIDRMPGKYVHRGEALLFASAPLSAAEGAALRAAFTIGPSRSFDQDLRYGVIVLSEVASKALSAAINDPGTAIDVVRAGGRVLAEYHAGRAEPPLYDRLHAPDLDLDQLYRELFGPIVRHGACQAEVMEAMTDTLDALALLGGQARAARVIARDARLRRHRRG